MGFRPAIKLFDTIAKALRYGQPTIPDIYTRGVIQLNPSQPYLQPTDVVGGIAFDGDFSAFLVDCSGRELADITANTYIHEYLDDNGVPQLYFELYNADVDIAYTPVLLRLKSTVSDAVWYSTPIMFTANESDKTFRVDYKMSGDEFMQSVSLKGHWQDVEPKITVKGYDQLSTRNQISAARRVYRRKSFLIEWCDFDTYDALLDIFGHDVIYIDGERSSDMPELEKGERLGNTNFFEASFSFNPNPNDTYAETSQVLEPFMPISLTPPNLGVWTLYSFPYDQSTVSLEFNKDVGAIPDDANFKLYKDGVLVSNTFFIDIISSGNTVFSSLENLIDSVGSYRVEVSPIPSAYGDVWGGFTGSEWTFEIIEGYYDPEYYDSNYYTI